ncbi:DNA-binding FadR family transcriptional regulator [Lipingzhangella halophila]|uniref:DNA-binding FadR family transcriptional regulator n=1 Tax=Lipingzhangella halophila TaxID=1783352 RepID=A0A7W7RF55_9ACTN|nr:FCD domain-containing protein [Lipingzhangella halophila]MBB4930518.1 DNA-binding FadR family transcriptional regulator [Lipingzhangella halophila]
MSNDTEMSWPEATISTATVGMIAQMLGTESVLSSRADRITRRLERAIAVGILDHGDKLPTETVLAEQLGVSSITLRQSLAELRAKGFIETKRGRGGGSYITTHPPVSQEQLIGRLMDRTTEELRELGDLAATIAEGVGRRAALRADSEDIRRAELIAGEFHSATTPENLRRTDSRFHIAVSDASHSERLANSTLQVHGELAELMWLRDDFTESARTANDEHLAILDAISRHDPDSAGRLCGAHHEREIRDIIELFLMVTDGGWSDHGR